jgi:ribosomal protein S8
MVRSPRLSIRLGRKRREEGKKDGKRKITQRRRVRRGNAEKYEEKKRITQRTQRAQRRG